jgi:hypothetical protein
MSYREVTRAKVSAAHLRLFHRFGKDVAVELYKGAADAALLNLMAQIGPDAARVYVSEVFNAIKSPARPFLKIDNTNPLKQHEQV